MKEALAKRERLDKFHPPAKIFSLVFFETLHAVDLVEQRIRRNPHELSLRGHDTRLARGKTVSTVGTTLDVVPTLFRAMGMLDDQNRIIPQPGAVPERVFLPFPGRVLDIFEQRPLEANDLPD